MQPELSALFINSIRAGSLFARSKYAIRPKRRALRSYRPHFHIQAIFQRRALFGNFHCFCQVGDLEDELLISWTEGLAAPQEFRSITTA